MSKFQSLISLKGKGVNKEKIRYIFSRLIGKPTFMGWRLKDDTIVNNGEGLFYCRKMSSDLHIISNSYEYDTVVLFRKLAKDSRVIVDVGANVGKYTILAGKTNQNSVITAIEPQADNFVTLVKNIKLNELQNVITSKIALGSMKGSGKLYEGSNKQNLGGYSLEIKTDSCEEVRIDTLDNLFDFIDLIKIDTEGSEFEILKGATRILSEKKIKKMIIEICDKNFLKVNDFFESYGYSIKHIQYNNYLAEVKD